MSKLRKTQYRRWDVRLVVGLAKFFIKILGRGAVVFLLSKALIYIGPFFFRSVAGHPNWMKKNLSFIYPTMSEKQLKQFVARIWGSVATTLVNMVYLAEPLEELSVEISGLPYLQKAQEGGKGAVVVFSHMFDYEYTYNVMGKHFPNSHCVHRSFSRSLLDRLLYYLRTNNSHIEFYSASDKEDVETFFESAAGSSIVCLAIDVKNKSSRNACQVEFLGKSAWTSCVAAELALEHGKELIPVTASKDETGQIKVHFGEPLVKMKRSKEQLTQELSDYFSAKVSESPEDWFLWMSNRWDL